MVILDLFACRLWKICWRSQMPKLSFFSPEPKMQSKQFFRSIRLFCYYSPLAHILQLRIWFSKRTSRSPEMTVPYTVDSIYTSSWIVRVAAASGLAQKFRIVLSAKVKIENSTSWVYSRPGLFTYRNSSACVALIARCILRYGGCSSLNEASFWLLFLLHWANVAPSMAALIWP